MIRVALSALTQRPLRTLLTMLAIVVGVATVSAASRWATRSSRAPTR
jgi:hypothetical protein